MRLRLLFALGSLALASSAACGNNATTSGGDSDGGTSSGGGSGSSSGVSGSSGGTSSGSSGGTSSGSSSGTSSGSSGGTSSGSSSGTSSGSSSGGQVVDGGSDAGVGGASVLMLHNHINRDGVFVDGAITKASAATFVRDTAFKGTLTTEAGAGGNVYASPLYVENGVNGKGTFYVATEAGTLFALDETTGAVLWYKNVAPSPANTGAGCGNIGPIGITGTPAIDLATRLIVFSSPTSVGGSIGTHMIYALSIDTGVEAWHLDASTMTDPSSGTKFNPQPQNQRSAVLIVNGIAYVAYGGHWGDCGSYHGWVIGVPLSGTGAKAWATKVGKAGIWGSGGPSSDGQSIFVTTGNGAGGGTWGDSEGLIRLDPGPTFSGTAADYFAAYNWAQLDSADTDLSGSGPLVIDAPSMTPSKLVMAEGKDGFLYLMDRSNLGGIATQAKPANLGALQVQSGEITNAPAWATIGTTTYVVVRPNGQSAGVGCPSGSGDLVGVQLDPTAPEGMKVAWCAKSNGVGSPSITTSDGTNDALVWVFAADQASGSQKLYAWDLGTGAPVFTGGGATDTAAGVRRFSAPIAVHGRIFVAGDNQLFAYKAR